MSRTGFRQLVAALGFRFCAWRADAALKRSEIWEDRAAEIRVWGNVVLDRTQPF